MERLEIVAGRRGIAVDHAIWRLFPMLTPCSQTPLTTTYVAKIADGGTVFIEELLKDWRANGDILAFVCGDVEE